MRVSLGLIVCLGCQPDPDGVDPFDSPPTDGTSLPQDPTDLGTTATTPTTPTTPPVVVDDDAVRFVAFGDAGEGNDAQFAVADAIEAVCAVRGCDFALYLGDNFYNTGVSGVDDEQFQTKFELPYENLDFPFYAVLGNHDLGAQGLGLEFWKADTYVEYTTYSTKWTMPDTFYNFQWGNVGFWGLDSTQILFDLADDQRAWLDQSLNAPVDWKIVFAHHPYRSNGSHGNAGEYEGISPLIPLTEIPRGEYVDELLTDVVCGRADVYLSGHDHTMQWLEPVCGTEWIVSGSGSKNTPLEDRGNATLFEDDTHPGFFWVEIAGNTFSGAFFDQDGNELFASSFSR